MPIMHAVNNASSSKSNVRVNDFCVKYCSKSYKQTHIWTCNICYADCGVFNDSNYFNGAWAKTMAHLNRDNNNEHEP